MDWKKGLSLGLKGIGAATKVAGALGVPYASMVGSAAAMGAKFLDGKAEKVNKEEMADRMEEVRIGQEDVKSDIKDLSEIMSTGFSEMTAQYQSLKGDLDNIQTLATSCFEILQEMHYLDGIENIDSAHTVFFSNCDDIEDTLASFKSHRFELQKQYTQHLNPKKIVRFFNLLSQKGEEGPERARAMYDYVVSVEAKFLQMMCVFHIYKGDLKSLGPQYELFVDHSRQLSQAHTCKKREIVEIYLRKFFWIFRKILG